MADNFCDLHMHSTASDGTASPRELAPLAKAAGLSAIALTDHDTTAGLAACAEACSELGIDFAPGIELSADPTIAKRSSSRSEPEPDTRVGTLHILGLFIDAASDHLGDIQVRLREAREQRNPQIVENLAKLGVNIDYGEVIAEAGGHIIGRPHIAQVLLKKGYVKSIQDAFARYIGEGKAAYARKDRLHAEEAIAAIHEAGGLAILAHPVQLKMGDGDQLAHFIKQLKELGLDGIETRHSDHSAAQVNHFQSLAGRFNLVESGGSDYHGTRKAIELGSQRVPRQVFDTLQATCKRDKADF